jgi:hypothetical protein
MSHQEEEFTFDEVFDFVYCNEEEDNMSTFEKRENTKEILLTDEDEKVEKERTLAVSKLEGHEFQPSSLLVKILTCFELNTLTNSQIEIYINDSLIRFRKM